MANRVDLSGKNPVTLALDPLSGNELPPSTEAITLYFSPDQTIHTTGDQQSQRKILWLTLSPAKLPQPQA
jgi:hypothetical protein